MTEVFRIKGSPSTPEVAHGARRVKISTCDSGCDDNLPGKDSTLDNPRDSQQQLSVSSFSGNGNFDFPIRDLPIKRNIPRNVSMNEFKNILYLATGSSSNIYSAVWDGQLVIIKVR
jgi:hypothetical protein